MKSPAELVGACREFMLEAKKNPLFEKIFAIYNRNLLKRRFHTLRASGTDNLLNNDSIDATLVYANHSSWWDGLVAFEISRILRWNFYVMMEEKQLKKLPLFRRLGAFSVVREDARQALESLNYAVGKLKEKSANAVWVFPQGEILPSNQRPIIFYNGLSRIVRKSGNANLIPVALKYEFRGEYKPSIYVKFGQPESAQTVEKYSLKEQTFVYVTRMTKILDELNREIADGRTADYKKIF